MMEILTVSEDTDTLDVMDNVEELYNKKKIEFWEKVMCKRRNTWYLLEIYMEQVGEI